MCWAKCNELNPTDSLAVFLFSCNLTCTKCLVNSATWSWLIVWHTVNLEHSFATVSVITDPVIYLAKIIFDWNQICSLSVLHWADVLDVWAADLANCDKKQRSWKVQPDQSVLWHLFWLYRKYWVTSMHLCMLTRTCCFCVHWKTFGSSLMCLVTTTSQH